MEISIIIVNYNLADEINDLLESFYAIVKYNIAIPFEIIVVDNNSTDKKIFKVIENLHSVFDEKLNFVPLIENIGFGQACNKGAEIAKGNILFFLNPDTLIKKNVLELIRTHVFFDELASGDAIVGLNVDKHKFLDFSAGYFPNFLFELLNIFSIGRYLEALLVGFKVRAFHTLSVDWVMGSTLLISSKLFRQLKGFNSEYFLYYEEMELCYKAKKINKKILYFSDVEVDHLGSVGSKKNYYFFTKMFYKGKLLFLKQSKFSFKFYSKMMVLHIYMQLFYWKTLNKSNNQKSLGKIRAFQEILRNIGTPEKISNKQV